MADDILHGTIPVGVEPHKTTWRLKAHRTGTEQDEEKQESTPTLMDYI